MSGEEHWELTYSLSVIAPFLNEAECLSSFLERTHSALDQTGIDYEIVLVNDGSDDESSSVIEDFISRTESKRIVLETHPENRGIFASWHTGLNAASKELVVLIDSDLQNPPEAISLLLQSYIDTTCHFVQGVRSSLEFQEGRLFFSRVLNTILNFAFKSSARDHKSGFVLGPAAIFKQALTINSRLKVGQTFIRAAIESQGYLVHETETIFYPRPAGSSFLAGNIFRTSLRVLLEIIIVKAEFRKRARVDFLAPIPDLARAVQAGQSESAREKFHKWLFFSTLPLHTWNISRKSQRYLEVLTISDHFTTDLIQQATILRLQKLLWHAFGRVPHYRRFFVEAQMLPSDLRTVEDIQKLPLLSKSDVRESLYFELFATGLDRRKLHRIATSGSTGTPFTTYVDWDQLDVRFATTLRAQQIAGWRFGDRQMRLWHQNLGLRKTEEFRERLNGLISRRTFIPAFELDGEKIRELVRLIEKRRPVLIDGYAESLNYLSQTIGNGRLKHAPRAIMTSAQILTRRTREDVEKKFLSKVFDKYGSREFSGIAYECEAHEGHHIQWESYIVEILKNGKPANPGEIGEVVITDLNNYSVPLIRYRIGDLAVAGEPGMCKCGRSSQRVGDIVGRTQALVKVSGGKWLPGTFFAHFFKEYETIVNQFQVVQESVDGFTLKIVRGPHWSRGSWQLCLDQLTEYVGPDTQITVEFVEQIPLLKTGKRTPVLSSLGVDFQSL